MTWVIRLPWPDKALSPNGSHGHWSKTAKARKTARTLAHLYARNAGVRPVDGAVSIKITFHPPDRRRRDRDNAIAMLKPSCDGLADVLGVDDSQWAVTYAPMAEPIKGGCVVVEVSHV